jgi:hypothetical protein
MSEETPLAPSEGFGDLRSEVIERGTVQPEKRKRGRPSNADRAARGETVKPKTVAPPVDMIPVETMVEIVALPFDIYAKRRGPHWKLSDEEKKQIGTLTNKVLNKYAPEWAVRFGDEIALATVLGMAIIARVLIDVNNRMAEDEKIVVPHTIDMEPAN